MLFDVDFRACFCVSVQSSDSRRYPGPATSHPRDEQMTFVVQPSKTRSRERSEAPRNSATCTIDPFHDFRRINSPNINEKNEYTVTKENYRFFDLVNH